MYTRTNFAQELLNGCDFSGRIIINADFRNTTIMNCNFSRAVLINCDFGGADISNCNFDLSYMKNVYMSDTVSKWNKYYMNPCRLSNSTFRKATIIGGDFSNSGGNLDFSGATLDGCIFMNTNWHDIIFTSSSLSFALMEDCRMDNSIFIGCRIENALFKKVSFSDSIFKDITFCGEREIYCYRKPVMFFRCNLYDAHIDRSFSSSEVAFTLNKPDSSIWNWKSDIISDYSITKWADRITSCMNSFEDFSNANENSIFDPELTGISININVIHNISKKKKKNKKKAS